MENVLKILEWLMQHKCMSYLGAEDDPCALARWVSRSSRQTVYGFSVTSSLSQYLLY